MKQLLTFLCLFTIFSTTFAQKTAITGKVIDSKSKEPLAGVAIVAEDNTGVVTDDKGVYILELKSGVVGGGENRHPDFVGGTPGSGPRLGVVVPTLQSRPGCRLPHRRAAGLDWLNPVPETRKGDCHLSGNPPFLSRCD